MDILLLSATQLEIQPVLTALEPTGYRRNGHAIFTVISGVGQVAACCALTEMLCRQRPDAVIQAGIAGVFNSLHGLGAVVQVQQDCFGDLGIEEGGRFHTLFDKGLAQHNERPYTDGWLVNDSALLHHLPLPKVKAVTVNKVSDSPAQARQLWDGFAPAIESMEGAALHYACLLAGVPFLQLRGISNAVGERDKSRWETDKAIRNLNDTVLQLVDMIQ
jgi:futalosine hydrolase